jgi:hypothetical protein
MDQGVGALLGALVGGMATFGGVAFGQYGVQRREREKDRRSRVEAELIAARILQGELAWAEARIKQALKTGRYWSARYAPKEDAWLQYREQIAVALDGPDEWSCVRDGFRAMRTVELQASRRRKGELGQVNFGEWGKKQLESGLERVERAITTLQAVSKDRPREALSWDPQQGEDEPSVDDSGRELPN